MTRPQPERRKCNLSTFAPRRSSRINNIKTGEEFNTKHKNTLSDLLKYLVQNNNETLEKRAKVKAAAKEAAEMNSLIAAMNRSSMMSRPLTSKKLKRKGKKAPPRKKKSPVPKKRTPNANRAGPSCPFNMQM